MEKPIQTIESKSNKNKAKKGKTESLNILFLGDSLTEGYQLPQSQSYPSLLQQKLAEKNVAIQSINAGISGDTTAAGLVRLKWYLENNVYALDAIFLALGANDGLRGLSTENTYTNLQDILLTIQKKNIPVILAGMILPRNYGEEYINKFEQNYIRLAKKHEIPFFPFILKDVAGDPKLNLDDGLHPNAQGYQVIAQNLSIFLEPIFRKIALEKSEKNQN